MQDSGTGFLPAYLEVKYSEDCRASSWECVPLSYKQLSATQNDEVFLFKIRYLKEKKKNQNNAKEMS